MNDRRRRWKTAITAVVTTTLAAFILLEIMTRVWLARFASDEQLRVYGTFEQNRSRFERATRDPAPPPAAADSDAETLMKAASQSGFMYEPHRYIGYIPAANFRRGANRHNEWGYRGEDFPRAKPKDEYRIAVLGGSTTYTSAVDDYTKSIPDQLQKILRERGLPQVRVINSGVPGWTSYETLANYEFRLIETDPDLLLIYDGINDVAARMVWPYRAYRPDNSGSVISPAMPANLPWYAYSDFVRTCFIAAGRMDSPMALHQVYGRMAPTNQFWAYRSQEAAGTYPAGIFQKQAMEKIFQANRPTYFLHNYENLIVLAQHARRDLAVFTFKITPQTSSYLNQPEFYAAIAEQNSLLTGLGRRLQVPVYDFATAFPDDAKLYIDAVHVNEEGARLSAELFAKFLLDDGLADKVKEKLAADQ